MSKIIVISMIIGLLIGCSKDDDDTGSTISGDSNIDITTYFALTLDDLPECTTDREGHLYYVQSTEDFRACTSGTYTIVDIKGDSGQDGQDGTNGQDGVSGLTADKSTTCSVIVTPGAISILLKYQFIEFNNGDVLVNCSATGLNSGGESIYYFSTQLGATEKGCFAFADAETADDSGFWKLLDDGTDLGAIYHDLGSAYDNQSVIFNQVDDCTILTR